MTEPRTRRVLMPQDRLIVALDYKPDRTNGQGREWVRSQVARALDALAETSVTVKFNSALRAIGYELIQMAHQRGLCVFADLKLIDIHDTMEIDGLLLAEARPEFVTVMCQAGLKGLEAFRAAFPQTEMLGITVLTNLDNKDAETLFGAASVLEAAMRFAQLAEAGKCDGLISSGAEVNSLGAVFGTAFTYNTPAIRPLWFQVEKDGQNAHRSMTPGDAIRAGADRIVVGRPIVQATNMRDAVQRTLDEIAAAVG